ncbi:MAG: S-methyl-5'-thioadenosine phosphorylase [Elusimicrobiota bacterium]|nr:S-methyl-5'-thioadenosine phosphorylase [Elusimicrobiota bacterium]
MNKIKIAVIGGSGVYKLDGLKDISEIEVDTPFGKPSDAIITGTLNDKRVAFLPRHGRGHYLIPSEVNYRANIYALKSLGVRTIISLSAVGSMKVDIAPGDMLVADQYFDRTKTRPSTFFSNGCVGHISFSEPVCPDLAEVVADVIADSGVKVHRGGTYICIEGPQFSTLGESRIYRSWGVDVIGMTALPEAKLAREAGICYSTIAMITDYDCWYPEHDAVTTDMVVKQINENSANAKKVIAGIIDKIDTDTVRKCGCRDAADGAVMTDPEKLDPAVADKLKVILEKI